MKRHNVRLVAAVSGPDGSGKSSLVRGLAGVLEQRGFSVVTEYCYGCFLCRRMPGGVGRGSQADSRRGHWAWLHAAVDATELALRVERAWLRARRTSRGRPAAVVTDRGPLDGLAKFDPAPGSVVARMFTSISRSYDLTLLLDAPAGVLAARDGEHSVSDLEIRRERYQIWGHSLPPVASLDTGNRSPAAVAKEAAELVTAAPAGRKKVVISTFDSPGNPYYDGGGAAVIDRLARWLTADFQVTVVTAGHRSMTSVRDGVRYRYLPLNWAGPRAGQLLFHAALPFAARRIPHDLWVENFTPPFSTSFLPLFSRTPVVGLVQNLSGEQMWGKYRIPFFIIERLGLRFYQHVVVLNAADRDLVRHFAPSATVRVIPNCVSQRSLNERLLGHGQHILFLGRAEIWQKGLDLLLAAYRRSELSMPLLIAGTGTRADERKLAVLLASAGSGARWLGEVTGKQKEDLLERSSFVVMPSRYETFPLSALEAMSYGKPIVHFDLPTLRWIEGDIRVRPFDVSALASEMRALAAHDDQRRELGLAAHVASQQYGAEQIAERYLSFVRELIGPQPINDCRNHEHVRNDLRDCHRTD